MGEIIIIGGMNAMRKTITVKEFLELTAGRKYNVSSEDGYGVTFDMGCVTMIYEEDFREICFLKIGQECQVSFNIDDCIETISRMENGDFRIEFNLYMADVLLTEIGA